MKFPNIRILATVALGVVLALAVFASLDVAAIAQTVAQTAAPVAVPSAGPAVAVQTTAVPSSQTIVDVSSLVTTALQMIALPIGTFLVWGFWKAVGLLGLKIDDSVRDVIDQGLEKAIGYGIARVQATVAGKPITIDTKNAIVAQAVNFATTHLPDALSHFGVTPAMLNDMLEARLGMMAATTASAPAVAAAPAATS